ncbi:hypothetical protein TWF718_006307 [Orbilia javanica]|uniref:F-box domain-containing protein n=1 Tax=Orbilia javanica TaxID=47235 RepID=A0AAN8RJU4_9PEZI
MSQSQPLIIHEPSQKPPLSQTVPFEIWQLIYAYLDYNGLASISCCSKFFRQTAVQLLFRHVRLSKEAIEGFGEGGSLGYLAADVREISFRNPVTYNDKYLRIFDNLEYICNNLHIFPNTRGVHINYVSNEFYYWIFPIAILRSISKYPWFSTLRSLSIKGVTGLEDSSISWHGPYLLPLKPDTLEFATGGVDIRDIMFDKTIPFPPALVELSFYYLVRPNFSPYRSRIQAIGNNMFFDGGIGCPGLNPPVLYPHWVDKLTKFTFRTKDFEYWPGIRPVYPNVKYLHAIVEICSWSDLDELAEKFPGLEEFRLETVVFAVLPYGYMFLFGFPKLKRARVPWRSAEGWEMNHGRGEEYLGPACEIAVLRREVGALVSGTEVDGVNLWGKIPAGGLRDLEYVEFVRGYRELSSRSHFHIGDIPFERYGMQACRVWREIEEWDVRLGSVWRHFTASEEVEDWTNSEIAEVVRRELELDSLPLGRRIGTSIQPGSSTTWISVRFVE